MAPRDGSTASVLALSPAAAAGDRGDGRGTAADPEKALLWLRRAAENDTLQDFQYDLANRLEVFPGTQRTLESLYLAVVAGTADYVELQQVLTAGQGITGIQSIPTYSNIEAGLGILTSRHVSKSGPYQLTEESLDSLKSGQYTKLLGF